MNKYCIDCKHVEFNHEAPDLSKCHRNPEGRDLVSGQIKHLWCNVERMGSTGCSRDGIYYESAGLSRNSETITGMLFSYDDPQLIRS